MLRFSWGISFELYPPFLMNSGDHVWIMMKNSQGCLGLIKLKSYGGGICSECHSSFFSLCIDVYKAILMYSKWLVVSDLQSKT